SALGSSECDRYFHYNGFCLFFPNGCLLKHLSAACSAVEFTKVSIRVRTNRSIRRTQGVGDRLLRRVRPAYSPRGQEGCLAKCPLDRCPRSCMIGTVCGWQRSLEELAQVLRRSEELRGWLPLFLGCGNGCQPLDILHDTPFVTEL